MAQKSQDVKRDEVLRRLLKTPPKPRKPADKGKKPEPMPKDDPEALVGWGKRNIQKDQSRPIRLKNPMDD